MDPRDWLERRGRVRAEFSVLTQDSGNVSWLLETPEATWFVKTAGPDAPPISGAPVPALDHAGRVALLWNAATLARSCSHPALPALLDVVGSDWGPMLVYQAVPGELLNVPAEQRIDPRSPYRRFAALDADRRLAAFDVLLDLHTALAAAGWIAGDLYDGCLIFDFVTHRLSVVDLDNYRRGPGVNDRGRMFGSSRFMAPEEFVLGAPIDQATTVFTLGRLIWHFGTGLSEQAVDFCGDGRLAETVRRAIAADPDQRYSTVAGFADAWFEAR